MKYLDITLEVLLNSLILSFVAAMIRIMFSNTSKFQDTVRIFLGSILFGIIIGYILNDFELLHKYLKIIIVIFSIFGKELFVWMEKVFSDPGAHIGTVIALIKAIKSINIGFTSVKENSKNDVN